MGFKLLNLGQSIVAAASLIVLIGVRSYVKDPVTWGMDSLESGYFYSIFLLAAFLGSSLTLMKQNAYPSTVFVGDTFCYFAGIILAIASMTSKFLNYQINIYLG